MSKLSKAQQNELIVWEYFIPSHVKWRRKTEEDLEKFFEWSEKGKHKDRQMIGDLSYFEALRQGKRWAGVHIHELYEKGILDGSMPYCTFIDKTVPREVLNFIKKEIFRGIDAEVIETYYQKCLSE